MPGVLARVPAAVQRAGVVRGRCISMISKTLGSSSTPNPSRSRNGYPVELDLVGKLAVVVGGGAVALRPARAGGAAGARCTATPPGGARERAARPGAIGRRGYPDGH